MPVLDILEGRTPPAVGSFTVDRINVIARQYHLAAMLQAALLSRELAAELLTDADAKVYVQSLDTLFNLGRGPMRDSEVQRWSHALEMVENGCLGQSGRASGRER